MGSLKHCLSVNSAPKPVADRINALQKQYLAEGHSGQEATNRALQDVSGEVKKQRSDIISQINKQLEEKHSDIVPKEEHPGITKVRQELGEDIEQVDDNSAQGKAVVEMAKTFKKKIVFFKGSKKANGFFRADHGDTLFINKDNPDMILFVFGHELLHALKKDNPKLYLEMFKLLFNHVNNFDSWYEKENASRKKQGLSELSEVEMAEEFFADFSGEQFTDERFWRKLMNHDATLFEKIVQLFKDLFAQYNGTTQTHFKGVYKAQNAMAKVMKEYARSDPDTAIDNIIEAEQTENTTKFSEMKKDVTHFSRKTFEDEKDGYYKDLAERMIAEGYKPERVKKFIDDITSVSAYIFENKNLLDYESVGDEVFHAIKANSDQQYLKSEDYTTICRKTLKIVATISEVMKRTDGGLTVKEIDEIREMLREEGEVINCGICYVFSRWINIGHALDQMAHREIFIEAELKRNESALKKDVKGFPKKQAKLRERIEEAEDGSDKQKKLQQQLKDLQPVKKITRKEAGQMWDELFKDVPHELIYDMTKKHELAKKFPDAARWLRGRGAGLGKAIETRTAYVPGLLESLFPPNKVKAQNLFSGMRMQSWSDFDPVHIIDMMQVAMERAALGLAAHAYTKVPDFVRVMAPTGVFVNMSLIPKGNGFDANGNLLFDDVEGMSFTTARRLRSLYPTAGTIAIGVSDAHIRALLAHPEIDYVIPYHSSGLPKTLQKKLGEDWQDYERDQTDGVVDEEKVDARIERVMGKVGGKARAKQIMAWEWWDPNATAEENSANFYRYADENGYSPRFDEFRNEPGAYKLMVDRRMVDKDGKYLKQNPTTLDFDMKRINIVLNKFVRSPVEETTEGLGQPNINVVDRWTNKHKPTGKKKPESTKLSAKDLETVEVTEKVIPWSTPQQEITSAGTSIAYPNPEKKAPKIFSAFRRGDIKLGPVNADIGGGRYDQITNWLNSKGVFNVVWDRFTRSDAYNTVAMNRLKGGQADTATISNVLNVIPDEFNRLTTIATAFDSLKVGGMAFFSMYEGDGGKEARQTKEDQWQEFRKTKSYIPEIEQVFGESNVTQRGPIIIAKKTQTKFSATAPRIVIPQQILELADKANSRGHSIHRLSPAQLRKRLDETVEKLYGKGATNKNRRADFITGLPASGKSSLADPLSENIGSMVVDSDAAKEALPEYDNGFGAAYVHEESSIIGNAVLLKAAEKGDNIILPIVGDKESSILKRAKGLLEYDYQIHIHYIDLPVQEAVRRVIARYYHEGRLVDPRRIIAIDGKPIETFLNLEEKGEFHGYQAYDNLVPKGVDPVPVDTGEIRVTGVVHRGRGQGVRRSLREEIEDLKRNLPGQTGTKLSAAKPVLTKKGTEIKRYQNNVSKTKFAAAYHGTPHDFDQFSLDAIGTGEGAQVYGHGLYFAGRRSVAEWYRDQLAYHEGTFSPVSFDGVRYTFKGKTRVRDEQGELLDDYEVHGLYESSDGSTFDVDSPEWWAAEAVNSSAVKGGALRQLNDHLKFAEKRGHFKGAWGRGGATPAVFKKAIELVEQDRIKPVKPGHTYKVELAPAEDEYLLWDRTFNQQSDKIKAALTELSDRYKSSTILEEAEALGRKTEAAQNRAAVMDTGDSAADMDRYQKEAAVLERQLGDMIRSPEYMLAQALKPSKLGQNVWGGAKGSQIIRGLSEAIGAKEASELLHSAGIRGVKYLDGNSRSKGEGAFNYVIFNDADVEITAKFSTKTPEFKKWFGDSKVVDENGDPKVVYHGTNKAFDEFSAGQINDNTFTSGAVVFFTEDIDYANNFAEMSEYGGNVLPVYIKAENMADFTMDKLPHGAGLAVKEIFPKRYSKKERWKYFEGRAGEMFVERLKTFGFDSAKLVEGRGRDVISYAVFSPTQIKSAIGNTGAFDAANPDIRYSARTPEFKKWFGDSQVVDENGDPQVMYHGTKANIFTFNTGFGNLIYVSPNPRFASAFAVGTEVKDPFEDVQQGGNVMPLYVKAENIFDADNKKHADMLIKKLKTITDADNMIDETIHIDNAEKMLHSKNNWAFLEVAEVSGAIGELGFDGIYISEELYVNEFPLVSETEPAGKLKVKNLAVFGPEQVKSAIGNTGAYSPGSFNIRYSARTPEQVIEEVFKTDAEGGDTMVTRVANIMAGVFDSNRREDLTQALDRTRTLLVDRYNPIDQALGRQAYRLHRMLNNAAITIGTFLHHGMMSLDNGAINVRTKNEGFVPWFHSLGKEGHKFMYWVAAKRAEKLAAQDRENWFTEEKRKVILDDADARGMTEQYQRWNEKLQAFNRNVVDTAIAAGLIDPAARGRWMSDFYLPFYRVLENPDTAEEFLKGPVSSKKYITSGIKTLKGGEALIGDPLENLMKNWTHLISETQRQLARQSAGELMLTLDMAEEKTAGQLVQILGVNSTFGVRGLNDDGTTNWADFREMSRTEVQEFVDSHPGTSLVEKQMLRTKNKEQAMIMSFMRNGKPVYIQVNDPELYEALTQVNSKALDNGLVTGAAWFKRMLTRGATFGPAFRIANMLRDTIHTAVVTDTGFKAFLDTGKGLMQVLRKSDDYISLMASGGGFGQGYLDSADPKTLSRGLKKMMVDEGIGAKKRILNTPRKLLDFWDWIGHASEMAARTQLYTNLKKQGQSHLDAAFEARDLLDFALTGKSEAVRIITAMTPFLNARMQGLDRMARGYKRDPRGFLIKGSLVATASLALWAWYRDDDRYKELEDWDKWQYHHFWIGDEHFRIPKAFEVGAIFGTLWESAAATAVGDEDLDYFGRMVFHTTTSTFAIGAPTAFAPLAELWANKSLFTGRDIETQWMKELQPGARYNPWDSETLKLIGKELNVSPKKMETLIRGYTATIGMGILAVADTMMEYRDDVVTPEKYFHEYLGLDRFFRTRVTGTNYATRYHEFAKEATQTFNTINNYMRTGDLKMAKEMAADNPDYVARKNYIESMNKPLANIRRIERLIWLDTKMSRTKKREKLEDLRRQKNAIYKKAYEGSKAFKK